MNQYLYYHAENRKNRNNEESYHFSMELMVVEPSDPTSSIGSSGNSVTHTVVDKHSQANPSRGITCVFFTSFFFIIRRAYTKSVKAFFSHNFLGGSVDQLTGFRVVIMATPFVLKQWETLTSEELALAWAKLAGFTEAVPDKDRILREVKREL